MKYTQRASGIIEAMVVLLLLTVGITWVYSILSSSQKLSNSTALRIEAIQIARDGLEAMTNIRNTNWIEFWWDIANCWNTLNYNPDCIWDTIKDITDYIHHWPGQWIRISKDPTWVKFFVGLQSYDAWLISNAVYSNTLYRQNFWVHKNTEWFYVQNLISDPNSRFTREIRINYLDVNNAPQWSTAINQPKMEITVIVQWWDPAVEGFRTLEVRTVLTNWKDRN